MSPFHHLPEGGNEGDVHAIAAHGETEDRADSVPGGPQSLRERYRAEVAALYSSDDETAPAGALVEA